MATAYIGLGSNLSRARKANSSKRLMRSDTIERSSVLLLLSSLFLQSPYGTSRPARLYECCAGYLILRARRQLNYWMHCRR